MPPFLMAGMRFLFAGMLMFAVALLAVFAIDQLATPLFIRRRGKVES